MGSGKLKLLSLIAIVSAIGFAASLYLHAKRTKDEIASAADAAKSAQRPQAAPQSARENRHRQRDAAHDWATTIVPWKSNRTRTSRSPACRSVRRSRVLSSV